MNLVSFAAVTAGGLVCELLNNTTTEIGLNGTYNSFQHNLMKNNSKTYEFNEKKWEDRLKYANALNQVWDNAWYGTHIYAGVLPEKYANQFEKILIITTSTTLSKWYYFLRLLKIRDDLRDVPLDENCIEMVLDSVSEYYFLPDARYINVEFEDVVSGKFVREFNLNPSQFDKWKQSNSYLYETHPKLYETFEKLLNKPSEK